MKKQIDHDDKSIEQAVREYFRPIHTLCEESNHDIMAEIEALPMPSWEEIERMADEIMKQEENPTTK